jgi:regulator of sirC expression with transglutaminase-like and TPR domain
MSEVTRTRLARLARQPNADPAEAALLVCAEARLDLDVDTELLRIDALADGLVTSRPRPPADEPDVVAATLADYLAGDLGFGGDVEDYHDPDNGLLSRVLDRRRGLPITLSVLYVAIARRLRLAVFPIALPGHVVVGVAGGERDRPVVLDPFGGGRRLDEAALTELVRAGTRGRLAFSRSMLRPATTTTITRRILDNLTRDFSDRGRLRDALWTVELKQLLPDAVADDHRARGELLFHLGRYRDAADAFETFADAPGHDAEAAAEAARMAVRARAKLN